MHLNPEWIGALAAVSVAASGFLLWLLRWLWHTLVRTSHFLDDYFGQPPREGMAARPGVMARLAILEGLVGKVIGETQPDGGNSLRDVVHKTADDVVVIRDEQARLRAQLELRNPPGVP